MHLKRLDWYEDQLVVNQIGIDISTSHASQGDAIDPFKLLSNIAAEDSCSLATHPIPTFDTVKLHTLLY